MQLCTHTCRINCRRFVNFEVLH